VGPAAWGAHAELLGELLGLPGVQATWCRTRTWRGRPSNTDAVLTLCSTDGEFARFPRPRWTNPLAA
jgi:hypothetical protein